MLNIGNLGAWRRNAAAAPEPPTATERQYLIAGMGYVNVVEDGREYLVAGMGYINTAGTE